MNVEKAKEWIEMYVNLTEGEFRQRVHTGEGILILPTDVFGCLLSNGAIESITQDRTGYYFEGDFGRTFITVAPFDTEKRRNAVTLRVVDIDRQKKNIVIYANRFGMSDAGKFCDLPDYIKEQLLSLPYSAIVRPLIISDMRSDTPVNISKIAVKYGVAYRTVYKWVYGA
jgi:hypothetical protein